MSTRARVGYKDSTGYHHIYIHSDGYPSWQGKILFNHYQDLDKIKALVAGGDVSSLAPSIECPKGHSYDTPVKGYTTFYTRDRGEDADDRLAEHSNNVKSLFSEEYVYIFDDGQWFVSDSGWEFKLLELYRNDDGNFENEPVEID